jgi:SAM-dependent methyltransferase
MSDVAMASGDKIRAHIDDFTERYSLASYSMVGLAEFCDQVDFAGKDVLEIGGWNLPEELTLELAGANSWVCVDMIGSQSGFYQKQRFPHLRDTRILSFDEARESIGNPGHHVLNGDATKLPGWMSDRFDIVISFAVLEHVLNLPLFLGKCHDALRPDGVMLARFGPIWSCHVGHHAWVSQELNFYDPGAIGPWGHLLFTPPEMYRRLERQGVPPGQAATAVEQLYTSSRINRLFAEDYAEFFRLSPFRSFDMEMRWGKAPDEETQRRLEVLHPHYRDFTTGAWGVVASNEAR